MSHLAKALSLPDLLYGPRWTINWVGRHPLSFLDLLRVTSTRLELTVIHGL